MTKDFRHIGRTSADSQAEGAAASIGVATQATQATSLPPNQRLVLVVIVVAALAFFAAGVWLLSGGRSPLPADSSRFLGIAFVISAVADIGIVFVLKRIWSRPRT